jgi:hypothetical protein
MISAVECQFYQGIIDRLDVKWIPDIYYTLAVGSEIPSYQISKDLIEAMEPFVGELMGDITQYQAHQVVNGIVYGYQSRREILIWVNLDGVPIFIEELRVVRDSTSSYRIAPYMDRTLIMEEVLANLEKK